MKSLFIALFLVSSSVFAANTSVLLQYDRSPGFMPRPVRVTVQVLSNGDVLSSKQSMAGDSEKTQVAKLSVSAVEALKQYISQVDVKAKLVDENPDAPRCMDAPSTTYTFVKNNKSVVFNRRSGCHTATILGSEILVSFLDAFVSVVK